jgi:hypothetical protein
MRGRRKNGPLVYIYTRENKAQVIRWGTIFIISERRSRGEWNKSETFPRRFKAWPSHLLPLSDSRLLYALFISYYTMYTSYAPVWHGLVYLYTKTLIICKWLPKEIKYTAWLGCSNGPLVRLLLVIILTMQPLVLCISFLFYSLHDPLPLLNERLFGWKPRKEGRID